MSPVTCQLSAVTCHQGKQPQPETLPLLTPPLCTLHSRLVHQQGTKKPNKKKCKKLSNENLTVFWLANINDTLQSTGKRGFQEGTTYNIQQQKGTATYRMNRSWGRFSENFKGYWLTAFLKSKLDYSKSEFQMNFQIDLICPITWNIAQDLWFITTTG